MLLLNVVRGALEATGSSCPVYPYMRSILYVKPESRSDKLVSVVTIATTSTGHGGSF